MFPGACEGALLVAAVPIRLHPLHHNPAIEPLTPAGIQPNSGVPFAAPNAQSMRLQSRERSRPQACGSERPQRPAPWQSHANRIQRRESERSLRGSICRERSGPRRGLTPPSRPTAAPYLRHAEAVDRGVCPLVPEATARAERPEPSPATCSFATLHRLPDAHHLRSLPETRCSPALAQKLCLFPPFRSASAAPAPSHAGHVEQAAFSRRSYQIPRLHHDPAL